MTQEDKQLLLKDLCARLPYGVRYRHLAWDDEHGEDYIVIIGKEMKKADENYLNSMDYLDNYCKEKE